MRPFLIQSYVDDDLKGLELDRASRLTARTTAEPIRTGLAEELLIAYFKPAYNALLRDWGTTRTVPVRAALDAGFRVVAVTLSAWYGLARLGSPFVDAKLAHVATFVLGRAGPPPEQAEGDGVGSLFPPSVLFGSLEAEVEASVVQLGVFGTALPPPAPWGLSVPDERLVQ